MKKINVLYVSPNGFLGGAEKFVLESLLGHKSSERINSSAISFSNGRAVELANEQGLKWDVMPFSFRFREPLNLLKAIIYLRNYCKENKVDLINACMPYGQLVSGLATIGTGIKTVWHQHGPVGGILDFLASFTMPDKILHNSNYTFFRHMKIDYIHRFSEIHEVVPLGIRDVKLDSETSHYIQKKMGENKKYVLTAGRLTRSKGYDILIKAIGLLGENFDLSESMVVLIAGDVGLEKDRGYKNELENIVKEFGLESVVCFLGHVDDMSPYYDVADVYVSCSTTPEGFGLVVAEAMAHGSLVIAPELGAIPDLVKNELNGFLFNPQKKDAELVLKNLLKKVCFELSENECVIIKEKAKNLINEKYTFDKMINTLEDCYTKVLLN